MSPKTPLKVAVLCSHRAPGLVQLLNADEHRGTDYEIVCCLSSSDTFAEEVRVERRGLPCIAHPIRAFCEDRHTTIGDLGARVAYDIETLDLLKPYSPNVIVLDGYLLLLTDPVLERFEGRIINLHHSDLMQRNELGGPRYPGLRAVRDALFGGETETRATAHIVTARLDDGPVLLRSWPFAVPPLVGWALEHGATDVLRAYAWAHQEWMLRSAWEPMLKSALELAVLAYRPGQPLNLSAVGRWALAPDGTLTPDGVLVNAEC